MIAGISDACIIVAEVIRVFHGTKRNVQQLQSVFWTL